MRIHDIASKIAEAGHDYEALSDKDGLYAIETANYITTSKKYIYDELASAQVKLLVRAAERGKKVVIYFQREDEFRKFDPDRCLGYAYRQDTFNQRADLPEEYADFPIEFGERTDIND